MTELINYVNYRVATPFDLPALLELDGTHPAPRIERWWTRRLMPEDEQHTVVHVAAHHQTKILVGYIVTTWAAEDTLRIDRMMVGAEFRRKKIGTRLLLRVLADKPFEATRMVYTVPEADLESQLFLKSVGFTARLPLQKCRIGRNEIGLGIKFEWNEYPDAI